MQPCFIRKNTKALQEFLEKNGYALWSIYDDEELLIAAEFNFKAQSSSMPNILTKVCLTDQIENIDDYLNHDYIDCGENEDLFCRIVLFDENAEYNQLYTNHAHTEWLVNLEEAPLEYKDGYHKATIDEIVRYYK